MAHFLACSAIRPAFRRIPVVSTGSDFEIHLTQELERKGGEMQTTRREFIASTLGTITGLGLLLSQPSDSIACLVGTWWVRCPNRHVDTVEDVTCNHTCEKCGANAVSNGNGTVVCPVGHDNYVRTGSRSERGSWLKTYRCTQRDCGRECCRKIIA